ncbi:hypothetical protein DYB37_013614, partial [Aphanomyces astaci]
EKGQHEDCLEEYVGEEYFDCRYFAKDLKATAGSTTTSRVKPSTVDPTLDFAELTRALAILHCRRLLLTILAASRSSNLLNDVPTELVGTFLKLVASYTSPASTVSELFKAVTVDTMSPRLEVSLVQCIDEQIRMASRRKYAKIHWDCGVEAIVTSQLSTLHCSDGGGILPSVWHDSHVLVHPNVGLAEYLTTLLASKQPAPLIQAWSYALRSPSMTLKEKAFRILSGLVPHVPESALACIPTKRLHAMTVARLTKEAIHFPIASKYLQSLIELTDNHIVTSFPTPQTPQPSKDRVHLGVIFRLHRTDSDGAAGIAGVVEYPDMSAVIAVAGQYVDESIQLVELGMIQGDVDMGWHTKFGCDRWVPGTQYELTQDGSHLHGQYSHSLWQPEAKTWAPIQGRVQAQSQHLFALDKQATFAASLSVSDDGLAVTCTSGEARNLSLGTVGFSSGIHYWEVRVDHAEFGSVFLGVCEKHVKGQPSLNLGRWQGWGFVNFRATYHNSTERIYGDHFNAGDTIGVCLNMES